MDPNELLYPQSKYEVLRTLFYSSAPVPLREIAYRSQLTIGSVQKALKVALKQKIISRKIVNNSHYYSLCDLESKQILAKIVKNLDALRLQRQVKTTNLRASRLLEELDERRRIINKARRSLNLH